jgi:hypothetical protein
MSPNDPTVAHPTDKMPQILSPLLCLSNPNCRGESHRSERSDRSSDIVVTMHPVIKRGLMLEAPISEMKLREFRKLEIDSNRELKLTQLFGPGLQKYRQVFQSHTNVSTLRATSLNNS